MGNYNSFPFIVDWNEDGKKDLIMGEQSPTAPNTGNVRIYLNQGTNSTPVLADYTVLYAGPNQLYKYRINPVVYDLDMDDLKDVIVGNDDGRVYFYKNVGTNAAPVFNAPYDTLRTQSGLIIDAGNGSRIHFVDWTGDGDLDLIVGGSDGYILYFENTTLTGIAENEPVVLVTEGPETTPNPITRTAQFSYSLETAARVRVEIYSVDGRLVHMPIDQYQSGGQHQFLWYAKDTQGKDLPVGIYLLHFSAGSETITKSIVITR